VRSWVIVNAQAVAGAFVFSRDKAGYHPDPCEFSLFFRIRDKDDARGQRLAATFPTSFSAGNPSRIFPSPFLRGRVRVGVFLYPVIARERLVRPRQSSFNPSFRLSGVLSTEATAKQEARSRIFSFLI